ncbi:MAG TPA: hypothetical protein GXX20_01475 [Clostridiaceae bacterium]|nr:hypothetical protein [Clostridiaceae bacterium]
MADKGYESREDILDRKDYKKKKVVLRIKEDTQQDKGTNVLVGAPIWYSKVVSWSILHVMRSHIF